MLLACVKEFGMLLALVWLNGTNDTAEEAYSLLDSTKESMYRFH